MVEGNISISLASLESGFNNLSHFNDQFKRVMNLTPTEYLSAYKNENLKTTRGALKLQLSDLEEEE